MSGTEAFIVGALMTLWDQFNLIHIFLPLQLLPHLIGRIEIEVILVILIALNWPRRTWYLDILRLRANSLYALLDCLHLLSQGLVCHLASQSLALMA